MRPWFCRIATLRWREEPKSEEHREASLQQGGPAGRRQKGGEEQGVHTAFVPWRAKSASRIESPVEVLHNIRRSADPFCRQGVPWGGRSQLAGLVQPQPLAGRTLDHFLVIILTRLVGTSIRYETGRIVGYRYTQAQAHQACPPPEAAP